MYSRHHNRGNGYRLSSMRIGLAASRISPEDSVRGQGGFCNPEFRGYNPGFGRSQPKTYKPWQLPPQERNIFVEAGRLAAEYLVSQGLLSPSVISRKWQNGSLKKQVEGFPEFRVHEGDNLHFPPKGQSHLGNAGGSNSRMSYVEDYSSVSKSHIKGRRRPGSFRANFTDWAGEGGRSVARVNGTTVSAVIEPDTYQEEEKVLKDADVGKQKSSLTELEPKCEYVGYFESKVEKYNLQLEPKSEYVGYSESKLEKYNLKDNTDSKARSSSAGEDVSFHEIEAKGTKISDTVKNLIEETGEVKDGTNNNETENQSDAEKLPAQQCAVESDPLCKSSIDLVSLCKFAKVPTKIRSSLTSRGSKAETVPNTEEAYTSDNGNRQGSEIPVQDGPLNGSLVNVASNVTCDAKCIDCKVVKVDARELGSGYGVEQGKVYMFDQVKIRSHGGYGGSSSIVEERGKKRAIEDGDMSEGTKKPRECQPAMVGEADGYFHFSDLSKKTVNSQEVGGLLGDKVTMAVDQESLVYNSSSAECGDEPCNEYAPEKQLVPNSFKICDLNLMGALDINENHNSGPNVFDPSISETKKEPASINDNLLLSTSGMPGEQGSRSTDVKDIEVIDLENDFTQESRTVDNSERKEEPVFIDLDSYSNIPQNEGGITDVVDFDDTLIISEFLGACHDIPPVPDLNPLQNVMGLHDGQGTVGDDDSIYMSLGEIPLSYLRVWEQPPQEF